MTGLAFNDNQFFFGTGSSYLFITKIQKELAVNLGAIKTTIKFIFELKACLSVNLDNVKKKPATLRIQCCH